LFTMPEVNMLYHSPYGAGWGLPQNYQPIHGLLRELKLEPYQELTQQQSLPVALKAYWRYLLIALVSFIIAMAFIAYVIRINRRLHQHQQKLSQLNTELEARVSNRTSQIESLLEHEQYLKGIVQTVADVNQIIITSSNRMEMLKSACDRLVSHPEYRFAWVASLRHGDPGDCIERLVSSYGSTEQLIALTQSPEMLAKIHDAIIQNQLVLISASELADERIAFCIADNWGIMDNEFNIIRKAVFQEVTEYKEGKLAVKYNWKWGFIDEEGEEIIPILFDAVDFFNHRFAAVKLKENWGITDDKGKVVVPAIYSVIYPVEGKYAIAYSVDKWVIITTKGRIIKELNYDNVQAFHEERAKVRNNEHLWGYINYKGIEIIPCSWVDASSFHLGLAKVKKEELWGVINKKGRLIIDYQ